MSIPPNIVLILADDLGFSDIGCYGGEIDTPSLDWLATNGTRMTQFYTTPRCSPSRAALLTGLHPHQVGIGILNNDERPVGYPGNLSEGCVTLAESLKLAGYSTYMCGKWHLASNTKEANDAWPTRRGFDRYFGSLQGGNYFRPTALMRDEMDVSIESNEDGFFYTDALSENASRFIEEHTRQDKENPFFLYLAYTAPHWPLHAHQEDIYKYKGRFDGGWEVLRRERLKRMIQMGIVDPDSSLSIFDSVEQWQEVEDPSWESRRMEVYAAQVDRMDMGIGRVVKTLERTGQLDNTIVMFLSDNGGCAEELPEMKFSSHLSSDVARDGAPVVFGNRTGLMPGPESTFQSYGRRWANVSNTPFREYKHWVHEGGIATPMIFYWPSAMASCGRINNSIAHITDIFPTVLEVVGQKYPDKRNGIPIPPLDGVCILSDLVGSTSQKYVGRTFFWEHEGNCAVRQDAWKLVKKHGQEWELYDIDSDRAERNDLANKNSHVVESLSSDFNKWATRCGVIPYEGILRARQVL